MRAASACDRPHTTRPTKKWTSSYSGSGANTVRRAAANAAARPRRQAARSMARRAPRWPRRNTIGDAGGGQSSASASPSLADVSVSAPIGGRADVAAAAAASAASVVLRTGGSDVCTGASIPMPSQGTVA